MTEGEPTDVEPSDTVAELVRERFRVAVHASSHAVRGEESIGWRGSSPDGEVFIQLFPSWRTREELTWSDAVARAASTGSAAAVYAIASDEGQVVVSSEQGPIMVFPFVQGAHRNDPAAGPSAAALLADVHRGISSSWDRAIGPRPGSIRWARDERADLMIDRDLDRWERELAARRVDLPIHGDFYGGNLLFEGDRIVGVIDWSDAELAPMEQEVAWAAWEFCQEPSGEDLLDDLAFAFLATYVAAGGPAAVAPPFDPLPWIRRRLRKEARAWFADARSATETDAYHEAQLIAFERLRDRRFPTL